MVMTRQIFRTGGHLLRPSTILPVAADSAAMLLFFSSLTFLDDDGSCDDLGQDRLGPALTILSVVVVVHHAALAANETHARATPGA